MADSNYHERRSNLYAALDDGNVMTFGCVVTGCVVTGCFRGNRFDQATRRRSTI